MGLFDAVLPTAPVSGGAAALFDPASSFRAPVPSSADRVAKRRAVTKHMADGQAATAAKAAAAARAAVAAADSDGDDSSASSSASDASDDDDDLPPALYGTDDDADVEGEAAAPSPASRPRLTPAQEAERLSRTLFVGNVPPSITKGKQLKRVFAPHGAIESVRLRCVRLAQGTSVGKRAALARGAVDATAPRAAYVVFREEEGAIAALAVNGEELGGRTLRVDCASARRARAGDGGAPPPHPPRPAARLRSRPHRLRGQPAPRRG